MRILAIDPGANGGLAWTDADGQVFAEPMPGSMTEFVDRIREIKTELQFPLQAIVEKVGGYMPGNSATAAVKFARHCGHIEAALYAIGVPAVEVSPQKWQKALGSMPREKAERKQAIKELMARRFPGIKVTLKTADALGILVWAEKREA